MEAKALLGICAWRHLEIATANCLHQADGAGYDIHYHWNDALISRARSIVASQFLQKWSEEYNVLVFIDTDIVFNLETLKKVIDLALEKGAVAVSPYSIRRGKHPWLAFRQLDNGEPVHVGPRAEPVPIKYGATGFMAIPRTILQEMSKTLPYCTDHTGRGMWPFFQPFPQEQPEGYTEYLSEDFAFCQRVQNMGREVWLRADTSVGHMGVYEFSFRDVLEYSSFQTEKEMALEDLSLYWSEKGKELPDRLDPVAAQEELAAAWEKANPRTPEEVEQFYQEQEAYVVDLVGFNSTSAYWREINNLLLVKGRVADFGGGIGSLAIALARRGCQVYYIDLPSPQRDFAEWRFRQHRLSNVAAGTCLSGLCDLDAIVSADTIEHLHPDTLGKYSKQFWDALKPGGQVRVVTRFSKGEVHPMHFMSAKQFEDAMLGVGFTGGPHIWVKGP